MEFRDIDESDDEAQVLPSNMKVSAAVKEAVKKLHCNTGHRSNRRLARSLAIAGAPPAAIAAAKTLQCSICQERRPPRARRPATLPTPKDAGDQVHIDLFELHDLAENRFYVAHVIDSVSKFQMAEVLTDKSADAVVNFMVRRWMPIFGPPRVLVADQGREFISWKFEEMAAQHSILLWHTAVQAPWQNGVCEKGGGILKAIATAVIKSQSLLGADDVDLAVQEAVMAYNSDINEAGVTPAQAALGRQPRMIGDVLGDFGQRLSEHGLVECRPSFARQVAMREVAKLAMLRLHFSRGLRRAEMARSRTPTVTDAQALQPGMIVYYYRMSKYNSKTGPSKRKLSLKRWHGPGLLVAMEGHSNCFISHKGQLVKAAIEHVRKASTMEQITMEEWESAIQDVVEAAMNDRDGGVQGPLVVEPPVEGGEAYADQGAVNQPAEASAPASVALQPQELVAAVAPALSQPVASAPPSRRSSLLSSIPGLPVQPSVGLSRPQGARSGSRTPRTPRSQLPRSRPEAAASQAHEHYGIPWPSGSAEVNAVQTARKEYKWPEMNESYKESFRLAAADGWRVWVDNSAVEVLSPKEAREIRQRLKLRGEGHKILTPRFVFTDKHDGLRTSTNNLGLKASARLVVPGYRDLTAHVLRKDAPTCSRVSFHLLLVFTSSRRWILLSADVKSAFLKGEEFAPGERELYLGQIKVKDGDEPLLPLGEGQLARLRKGIFGLSDSPRRWYLRLHKSLTKLGWQRSSLDAAMWFLWSDDGKTMEGIVVSHVDDLLMGGSPVAIASLEALGRELGFGSLERGSFVYCGKRITQHADYSISIDMKEYHENLAPAVVPMHRRRTPDAPLTPDEQKKLRALLGSLQWLVSQLRADLGFQLSTLQGDKQVVGTLLKANSLVRQAKLQSDFALRYVPQDLARCGLMVVTDASLGNVTKAGSSEGELVERVFSQATYVILLADEQLMEGKPGRFNLIDARSHRLGRVCRSTFGAELLASEEGLDAGHFCRGAFAEMLGYPMEKPFAEQSMDLIPLQMVTDAKDNYDKCNSDTPTYGSQKSLAFTIAWIRSMLRRDSTMMKWTATDNMFVDGGTKLMKLDHMARILQSNEWCVTFSPGFVKQTVKKPTKTASSR